MQFTRQANSAARCQLHKTQNFYAFNTSAGATCDELMMETIHFTMKKLTILTSMLCSFLVAAFLTSCASEPARTTTTTTTEERAVTTTPATTHTTTTQSSGRY